MKKRCDELICDDLGQLRGDADGRCSARATHIITVMDRSFMRCLRHARGAVMFWINQKRPEKARMEKIK